MPIYSFEQKLEVQPTGVGNVPWKIIAKTILHVIGNDIHLSPGAPQTCAGHDAGSEATIHAMRAIFEDNNAHAALLVNATNAFNLVDCQTTLHNISTVSILFYHLKRYLRCTH